MEEVLPRDRLTITFEITGELTRRVTLAVGGEAVRVGIEANRHIVTLKFGRVVVF
jgi:hypothetical protein